MFSSMTWLRNQVVQKCREGYADRNTAPTFYDQCKSATRVQGVPDYVCAP